MIKWTPRQLQVIALLKRGETNATIAHELNIATVTVKLHIQAIFEKLQVTNRTKAALMLHGIEVMR